tara:strand:+ start:72902 stop:73564 length:663 start_codon:yes stop_codon:yes gene_type:complete
MKYLILIILAFSLSSCFEIIEEVNVNNDGSGALSYTVNLSQSRTKINSLMLLDSIKGQKIPDENDLRIKINEVLELMEKTEGITNLKQELNFNDYIFKFSCDFAHTNALNEATRIVKSAYDINDPYANSDDHFTFDSSSKSFRRKGDYSDEADLEKVKQQDLALLKNAEFTGIYRFQSDINSVSNTETRISPNKRAAMIKVNVLDLMTKKYTLENIITLN